MKAKIKKNKIHEFLVTATMIWLGVFLYEKYINKDYISRYDPRIKVLQIIVIILMLMVFIQFIKAQCH
jgi:hypothetical protein